MIKTILVAATGSAADTATLEAALAIARPFDAHLDVLHVRLDAVGTAVAMTTDSGSGALTAGLLERLEQDARAREKQAHDIFARFCADAGITEASTPALGAAVSAEWHAETGAEPRWMATYGTAADLIVARRGGGEDAVGRSTLEAVLLECGRPVLIPAASPLPATFERIAIAWKPTPQAARAAAFAMPFLRRANELLVVTVDEAAEATHDAERLVRNLAWRGLAAKAERLTPGPEGAAPSLLAGIAGRADLMVMGGYGHSRLRELVFGGFTQHMLADAPLPVLIAH
jgi:nucleotide-binding universal stress UspA family protein